MSKPIIHGTAGDDSLTGTSGADLFALGQGGSDSASGLGGNDTFSMRGALDAGDQLDGGTGNDVVVLNGDYSGGLTFDATTLTSIETLRLDAGFSYDLTSVDETVAAGAAMKIDGSRLGAGDTLTFDGSAETDGVYHLVGGAGDDVLTGGADGNTFNLAKGGEDTATGGAGNDIFTLGATLDAGDEISGGFGGNDVLRLDGDYSAGLTLGPDTLSNISTVQFAKGHSYNLTVDNANFLSGPTALINAGALGAANSLTFDASASDANFHFIGGAGNDVLTGGTAGATFDLSHGGNDTATGGVGADNFNMGATFTAADKIDGGAGDDRVVMDGMGAADSLTFSATTMTNVETLTLQAGHDYDLITNDATVAAGATLLVAGNALGAGDTLTFDGAAETDGHFIIRGGAGNDVLTGGQDGDTFNLVQGGEDTVTGGAGNDTINTGASFDSGDQIDGGAGSDTLSLNGTYASAITVSGTMVQNVETVTLAGGGYNITWQSPIASGLTVDASTIGSGNNVVFDDSALASGNVHFIGGAGESVFRGGGGDDVVDVQNNVDGLNVSGGGGDDTVNFGAAYGSNPFEAADGGTGSNTATFDGDYSAGVTVGPSTFFGPIGLRDFQTIALLGDHSYAMTFDDSQGSGATLTGGAALTVDASALGAGDQTLLDFSLSQAAGFTVTGGAGDDDFVFAANFAASDTINGGAGSDTLELKGDYSAGLTFGATTMTNVETLQLDDGSSYKLTTNDATVASGQTLTVDASALTGTNALTFDGSAETNGLFAITGGAGDDTVTLGSHFSVSDAIDGGAGDDTVHLNAKGGFTFTATTLTNVEDLIVSSSGNIRLTTNDTTVASGATLTVDLSPSSAVSGEIQFDGSAETNGHFNIAGPANAEFYIATGGALSDTFTLGNDGTTANVINGGGGNDTLTMTTTDIGVQFNGGDGNDTLALTGGGTIGGNQILLTGVELLTFGDNNWNVTPGESMVSSGATLTVDASALTSTHSLAFNGSGETDGDFVFEFAGNFIVGDSLTGSANNDTLKLNGDYSGGVTFGASTISSIETITVADGHTYGFVTNDANVASGATLTVDASALTGANQLFFSGNAETDGHFAFIGGAADDDLEGGAQSDTFDLSRSDGAFVSGNGGNDSFTVTSAAKFADDSIDGGAGSDTLILNGGFSTQTAITASNVTNIEALQLLGASNSYDLTIGGGIAGAATLSIDGSAASSVTVDASGAPATAYAFIGSAGNDTLTVDASALTGANQL
ncbi:MAG TPA: calcium-binding protein, partial [Rhizomicrobium sp.]|nr:calcium-binding protein [Rhizomicrobium sp.]